MTAGGAGRSDESLFCFSSFHFLLLPVQPGTACWQQPEITDLPARAMHERLTETFAAAEPTG